MPEAKDVVIYGVVITGRNHHRDYITVGHWDFLLVEKIAPVVRPKQYRVQWTDARGRFVRGTPRPIRVTVARSSKTGRFVAGGPPLDYQVQYVDARGRRIAGTPKERHIPIPERELLTGKYARERAPRFSFGQLPSDDVIISQTKWVVRETLGADMYRTPLQTESGGHNVEIGIQHLTEEQVAGNTTYTFAEYLAELKRRLENEREKQ